MVYFQLLLLDLEAKEDDDNAEKNPNRASDQSGKM